MLENWDVTALQIHGVLIQLIYVKSTVKFGEQCYNEFVNSC